MPVFTTGNSTLADIKAAVRAHGYQTDDTTLLNLINGAYRVLLAGRSWPFLETTSTALTIPAGEDYVSLGVVADLLHLEAVRISDGDRSYSLEPWDAERVRRNLNLDRVASPPVAWARRGANLYIYPRPDVDYVLDIDYAPAAPPLAVDDDVLQTPAIYDDAIVMRAVQKLAFRERDWAAADRAGLAADSALQRMASAYSIKDRQQPTQVKPYWNC